MTREPGSTRHDGAPDFDVKWPEPDDAMHTWSWDSAHEPYPLTPLSIDFSQITGRYCSIARGEEPRRTIYVHGYAYGLSPLADHVPAQASDDEEERKRRVTEAAPRMLEVWEREYLPRIRTVCREMRRRDYSSMSIGALSSALDTYMDSAARAFALTEEAAGPMLEGRYRFVDFCTDQFGPEGEARAAAMEQGFANESTASDVGLWSLARLARGSSTVDGVLRRYRADELPAVLPAVPGGATFMREMDRYLDRFGWRTEMWGELSMPTWREYPRQLLRIVQSYISGEVQDPRKALARSANRRRRMVKRVRARLERRPGLLAVLDSLLPMVRQVVPVKEGRALWQLAVGGSLRIPCLAVGRKLREMGVIESIDDVFYLRLREIKEIAAGRGRANMRDPADERRADRDRWMPVLPPATIGTPPRHGADDPSISSTAGHASEPERVLTGMAASPGLVRGPAKVVLALAEATTLATGDIMVSRTRPRIIARQSRARESPVHRCPMVTTSSMSDCDISRAWPAPVSVAAPGPLSQVYQASCTGWMPQESLIIADVVVGRAAGGLQGRGKEGACRRIWYCRGGLQPRLPGTAAKAANSEVWPGGFGLLTTA